MVKGLNVFKIGLLAVCLQPLLIAIIFAAVAMSPVFLVYKIVIAIIDFRQWLHEQSDDDIEKQTVDLVERGRKDWEKFVQGLDGPLKKAE